MKRSSNVFTKNRKSHTILKRHEKNGWSGANVTDKGSSAGGDELNSGTPYGIGEFGGIAHFRNL